MVLIMSTNEKKLTNESVHGEDVKNQVTGKVRVVPALQSEVRRWIYPSRMLFDAAEDTRSKASAILKGGFITVDPGQALLDTYFLDALRLRLKLIHDPASLTLTERMRQENYPLPSVVYNAIRQIGIAKDLVHFITYVPELHPAIGADLELDDAQFEKCRRMLESMSLQSDFVVSGILNGTPTGDLYLMAMDNNMPEDRINKIENEYYTLTDETVKEWKTMPNEIVIDTVKGRSASQAMQPTMLDTHVVTGFYSAFFYKQPRTGMFKDVYVECHASEYEFRSVLNTILFVDGSCKTMTEVVNELSAK